MHDMLGNKISIGDFVVGTINLWGYDSKRHIGAVLLIYTIVDIKIDGTIAEIKPVEHKYLKYKTKNGGLCNPGEIIKIAEEDAMLKMMRSQ